MTAVKTKPREATKAPTRGNGELAKVPVEAVLTLAEAAAYLRVPEEAVVNMVHTQGLVGRLIGTEWRFLKSALQNWLGGDERKTSKQALLDLAGKFKDDPYLEEITREAYRKRGRPIREASE